jgi:hypothetical protein
LIEKVILNLIDCDSWSNHITVKTTDEKVISLTKSDALLNQHDVLGAAEHAPVYGDEFGTCRVKFSMRDDVSTLVSLQRNEYSRHHLVQMIRLSITSLTRRGHLVVSVSVVHLLLQLGNFLSGKSHGKCMKMQHV